MEGSKKKGRVRHTEKKKRGVRELKERGGEWKDGKRRIERRGE